MEKSDLEQYLNDDGIAIDSIQRSGEAWIGYNPESNEFVISDDFNDMIFAGENLEEVEKEVKEYIVDTIKEEGEIEIDDIGDVTETHEGDTYHDLYTLLTVIDYEKLFTEKDNALDRYEYEEDNRNLKGIDENTIQEVGPELFVGFNHEEKTYVIYEDFGDEQNVLEATESLRTLSNEFKRYVDVKQFPDAIDFNKLEKEAKESLERHNGKDNSRGIGR